LSATPPKIFVILTGVSGNLGDAVIRRRVLEWARGTGEIHAYVGRTTGGWVEQLGFRSDEQIYNAKQRRRWLKTLLFGRGPRALIFDPGEVPLGPEHMKSEAMFAAISIILRLRGAVVVRPPRAIAHLSPLTGAFHWLGCVVSNHVLWRNEKSISQMKVGKLVPDTAFHEPFVSGQPASERRNIVVSLRGKRDFPTHEWFDAISTFASENNLGIQVMSQVDEDEERSKQLGLRFGSAAANYLPWGDRTDIQQELAVRALYESAAFVISDRLHVLILSAIAGAQPIEVVANPNPKVREHFATIGMDHVSMDVAGKSAHEIRAFLDAQRFRRAELEPLLQRAQADLDAQILAVRRSITADRT